MKKLLSWVSVIVVCVLVSGGLGYYKYAQISAAIAFGESFPEPAEAVEPFVAQEQTWQPVTSVTAEVVALRTVELRNELAGSIVEVGFAPGAQVVKDQLLLRLDTSEEQAQLAAARADAELARLELARYERLIGSGAAAQEATDRARATFAAATARVQELSAIIDKKTLRAPFDGFAGLHQLAPGQYLESGSTIVRLVGSADTVWVDFTLPQEEAPALAIGDSVQVRPAGEGARRFAADVIARDSFVNVTSRNLRFRTVVSNAGGALLPGSLISAEVPIGPTRRVVMVPMTAVRRDAFGAAVYVIEAAAEGESDELRARRRGVGLGDQRDAMVIVTAGLASGERVAANGAFKLREGTLVNPVSPEPVAAAAQP